MANKIFKYTIILFIIGTFLLIIFNPSTRKMIFKLSEIHKLEKNIERISATNETLKKRLLYLQTKPEEMEKAVKSDLGYIAEDEILYKFNDNDDK